MKPLSRTDHCTILWSYPSGVDHCWAVMVPRTFHETCQSMSNLRYHAILLKYPAFPRKYRKYYIATWLWRPEHDSADLKDTYDSTSSPSKYGQQWAIKVADLDLRYEQSKKKKHCRKPQSKPPYAIYLFRLSTIFPQFLHILNLLIYLYIYICDYIW